MYTKRVLSGMRPTGSLHLGHYHGVLKNWLELQVEDECLFFVADWNALTTHYDNPEIVENHVLIYRADQVLVGEDQVPHVEFTKEIASRFNHLFSGEVDFVKKVLEASKSWAVKGVGWCKN